MTVNPAEVPPVEDVNRGTVLALLAIPAGVIAWVLLGTLGFIASIVTYGVALFALFLYTRGSGGLVGRAGAVRITIITLVTVALSIVAGLVSVVALGIARVAHVSPIEALSAKQFPATFGSYIESGDWVISVLIGVAFGILGCYSVLRNAFRATATPKPMPWATEPTTPEAPAAEQKP